MKLNDTQEALTIYTKMLEEVDNYAHSVFVTHEDYRHIDVEIGRTFPQLGEMMFSFALTTDKSLAPLTFFNELTIIGEAKYNHATGEVGIEIEKQYVRTFHVDIDGEVELIAA